MAALQEITPTAVEIHVTTVAGSVSFIISSNIPLLLFVYHLLLTPLCQRALAIQIAVHLLRLVPVKTSDTLDAMTNCAVWRQQQEVGHVPMCQCLLASTAFCMPTMIRTLPLDVEGAVLHPSKARLSLHHRVRLRGALPYQT